MCRFLPAPSVRRATGCITSCAGCWGNFYPRPPRGGRRYTTRAICRVGKISIHALREEGDKNSSAAKITPRLFLSTPSARRATSYALLGRCMRFYFYPRPPRGGRLRQRRRQTEHGRFLSTPSARRATRAGQKAKRDHQNFYPRPPRGGRPARRRRRCQILCISIHALREEGDTQAIVAARKIERFLSTPSARRATIWPIMLVAVASFLSTPSARRATCEAFFLRRQLCISIHALREEGDCTF